MWKWILIGIAAVAIIIGAAEIVRRSGQEEPAAAAQAPLVEHLQGKREYSDAQKRALAEEKGEDDFQRGERINDSREKDLEKAKDKVKVFTKAIKGE